MPAHNSDIARILNEVADLLELDGENPFRVRCYRDAARAVRALRRELSHAVAAGVDLSALPLGDLAPKVEEILETGGLDLLEELRERVPAGLAQMAALEGLGPKRVMRLREALGVEDVPALRRAAQAGRVRALPDFGVRTEAALLDATRAWVGPRVVLRSTVEETAADLLDWLSAGEGVERCAVAGAFRRRAETVDRLVLVAAARDAAPVLGALGRAPGVAEAVVREPGHATARVRAGLPLALHVVQPSDYGSALHRLTGNEVHMAAVRDRVRERGAEVDGGADERAVYDAAGLPFVEPELREARGELEAAETGRLPRLLELGDLRGDLHVHTDASDGRHDLETMVEAARASGLEYIAVTDHSPHPTVARGMDADTLRRRLAEVDRLNERLDGFRVLRAAEVDIHRDGSLDYPDDVLAELDVVVCSVHRHLRLSRREQTERVLRAMSNEHAHILGHPTARKINRREPINIDLERVMDAAANGGWAMELDSQPNRLDLNDLHARAARERGARLVVSSDAHNARELANLRLGVDQARRGWVEKGDVLNTLPVEQLLRALP